MGLYENVRNAAKIKGYSVNRLEQEIGFARSSISKFNKNTPSAEKIQQIADFLGVSFELIMSGEERSDTAGYYLNEETAQAAQEMYDDPDMRTLFDMKRNMPADRFAAHIKFMRDLYEKENPSD